MLLALVAIASGLAILVWGADRFVLGAAGLARSLGIPPLLIGLTVVGFGTSAPEILVEEVVGECRARFDVTIQEITVTREHVQFKLPRVLTETNRQRGAA